MSETRARILIVDDTPANIHVLMEALKDTYAITAATSGAKALDIARGETPPDIILLDIMMPEMDGYEVCRQLKEDVRTERIPVIFITALTEEDDEARGLDLGAVDFVTKPFRPGIVKSRVRNHIELKRHRDNLQCLVNEQVEEIADSHIATIFAMSKLAESRDDDTGKHLERTQIYCRMLAEQLAKLEELKPIIDSRYIETIFHASPLHDIGKVAVPDAVLCKPGKLTDDEFAIMKTHTMRGAETLFLVAKRYPSNEFINMGLDIARWHHEKWAGGGYPDGISGREIPLCARIMAVSDVYDALTSKRCYKEAMPHDKAASILRKDAGTHFDPMVVEAFEAIQHEFDHIRGELGN
ncbi:MAG: response regulator [Candidatus Hydrogenedens sp.]|nr:response regulator [Candidatus Hydrogenedens sp.]